VAVEHRGEVRSQLKQTKIPQASDARGCCLAALDPPRSVPSMSPLPSDVSSDWPSASPIVSKPCVASNSPVLHPPRGDSLGL